MKRPERLWWSRSPLGASGLGRVVLSRALRAEPRLGLLAMLAALVAALLGAGLGCSPQDDRQAKKTGSQTNWLRLCDRQADCGDLQCVCGVCSTECDSRAQCAGLDGASCVAASDPGAVAACGGATPPSALCLPRCDAADDAEGTRCVAGVSTPVPEADVRVRVELDARHQTLLGFGASLAYAEDEIVAHSQQAALFDLMFTESGFEAVRFRNRYGADDDDDDLGPTSTILAAAEERLGARPALFMTSATPPAELKANASRGCAGDSDTCTLRQLPAGGFDYASFAEYWRASLEAHAEAGIFPDYVSIQNDPDWVPDSSAPAEACRFLPEEGEMMVMMDRSPVRVAYPGYKQALDRVLAELADLPDAPALVAPETTSVGALGDYADKLESSSYAAVAYHLYDTEAASIEPEPFERLRELGERTGLPLFQTEMRADGLSTAILIHYSMALADAAVYLQNDFVVPASAEEGDPHALIALTPEGFETQGPYHALVHFARFTDAGWVRVDASVEQLGAAGEVEILGSAYLSADEAAVTVVLVNPGERSAEVELELPEALLAEATTRSVVERTVFDGVERSAELGALPPSAVVTVPAGAVVTVAVR